MRPNLTCAVRTETPEGEVRGVLGRERRPLLRPLLVRGASGVSF